MYASARHYWVKPEATEEILEWVESEFVEQVRQLPGFVAYYVIDGGDGKLLFVTIFNNRAAAEESHRRAMVAAREKWGERLIGLPREEIGAVRIAVPDDS